MEPIKFEEDFKGKLDKRTIAPSNGAWDELSERLDAEAHQKPNKGLWWLGIAASVVGVLFVVSQFFMNETETVIPEMVNNPDTEETTEKATTQDVNEVKDINSSVAIEAIEIKEKEVSKHIINNTEAHTVIVNNETSKAIAQDEKLPTIKGDKDLINSKHKVELHFEIEKVQEVADAIHILSKTELGVSNADIDTLLKQAQREILLHRMKNEDKVLVDAALLLQEVEFELDQSFRDKVFKALKNSYGSVKTAIAKRND